MAIKVGCFALIDPFSTLEHQLQRIEDWGFKYADVTDSSDGGSMGVEYGFAAVASLDANPFDIKRMFDRHGLKITTWCAHANLLDPTAPWRFGTSQIIKAVRAAAAVGVEHVVTSEGDPHTEFGHGLTDNEALFLIRERLYEPLRIAEDHGVKILLEPHGKYTDSIDHMEKILEPATHRRWLSTSIRVTPGSAAPTPSPWSIDWPIRSNTCTGKIGRRRWRPTAASSLGPVCRASRSARGSWM
jgi:inosose dehydratase